MPLLKRFRKQQPVEEPTPVSPIPQPVSRAKGFVPPPPRSSAPPSSDPREERLRTRIQELEDAIGTVERSGDPDSPYQQRLAVLTNALEAVDRDLLEATPLPSRDVPSLPATPIRGIDVLLEPVPQVSFSIGSSQFRFAEEIDWAERGTQIVRGDLVGEDIDPDPLIPPGITGVLRDDLRIHLDRSLFAFATDLRDRAVEVRTAPSGVTLADLAIPSPECGDWELWGGVSLRCLDHALRLRTLSAERTRLLNERGAEIEERQRQVEELPIQRRRLNQALAELRAIESER